MERKRKWTAWARENAPEKLEQRIHRHRAKIADLQEALKDILEDLAESEAEGWEHGIECERNALKRVEKEISEAEAMLAIYL